MLGHVLDAAAAAGIGAPHVVLGHGAERVRGWLSTRDNAMPHTVIQAQQLGTAHAVSQAMPEVPDTAMVPVDRRPSLNVTKDASVPGGTADAAGDLKQSLEFARQLTELEPAVPAAK